MIGNIEILVLVYFAIILLAGIVVAIIEESSKRRKAKLVEINRIKHYNNILYKRYLFFKNLSEVDSYYADKK